MNNRPTDLLMNNRPTDLLRNKVEYLYKLLHDSYMYVILPTDKTGKNNCGLREVHYLDLVIKTFSLPIPRIVATHLKYLEG